MTLLKNIVLMSASFLIVVTALEAVLQVLYGVPARTIRIHNVESYYMRDDELDLVPRKNVHGEYNVKGKFTSTFRTNSRGFRDKEYTLEKPEGVGRIVVVGDSFSWGLGVNDDEVYTERLEFMLSGTEVINLGVTGYNTKQERIYFQREGIKYDPEILIIQFYSNDLLAGNVRSDRKTLMAENKEMSIMTAIKINLSRKSALYNFVRDRVYTSDKMVKLLSLVRNNPLPGVEDMNYELWMALREEPELVKLSWERTSAEILKLIQYATDMGVRSVVAVVPTAVSFHEKRFKHAISYSKYDVTDFDLDKPYRVLREFADKNGIEMIIPLERFKLASRNGRSLYHHNDGHFNAAGHELFAQAIADYLLETSPGK